MWQISTNPEAQSCRLRVNNAGGVVAKCPGMAGTVPEFGPMSRPRPSWHKRLQMSRNFCNLDFRRANMVTFVQGRIYKPVSFQLASFDF